MWEHGDGPRSDGWSLIVIVSDTGPFTDEGIPGIQFMRSGGASALVGSGTQDAGSIRFDGLVLDAEQSQGAQEPMELAGTIEWSCRSGRAQARPMRSRPPRYGRSGSGTTTDPSGCWWVSSSAAIVRGSARPDPLRVWTSSGFAPARGR